jgi:hypothetical protein
MGQQGLVFVFLPALLLWGARGLTWLLRKASRPTMVAVTTVLLAINIGIFCFVPEYPLNTDRVRLLTRSTLVNSDRYYQDRFEVIKSNFAPKSTAILAANWHHIEYYLPEYVHLPFSVGSKWEVDEGRPTGRSREVIVTPIELGLQLDNQGQAAVIIFDPDLMPFNKSSSSARELPLRHGGELKYLVLTGEETFHYGSRSFGVKGE